MTRTTYYNLPLAWGEGRSVVELVVALAPARNDDLRYAVTLRAFVEGEWHHIREWDHLPDKYGDEHHTHVWHRSSGREDAPRVDRRPASKGHAGQVVALAKREWSRYIDEWNRS